MTENLTVRGAIPFLLALVIHSTGCMMMRGRSPQGPITPAPVVLGEQPSLDDVMQAVNKNTAGVRQLQTTSARISIPQANLRASIALERPRKLRLIADHVLAGQELDLGSNDNMFWAVMQQTPVVYYGRHDQVGLGMARDILPMPPDWLIEALGLVQFEPTAGHDGPRVSQPGRLDVRSTIPTPNGNLTRITVVDDQRATVLEQHVYDQDGHLLASAFASEHRYDPLNGVALPHRVQIQFPTSQLSLVLEVDEYIVNQLSSDPASLWAMPQPEGYTFQDITKLDFSQQRAADSQIARTRGTPSQQPRQLYPLQGFSDETSTGIRQARSLRRLPPFSRIR